MISPRLELLCGGVILSPSIVLVSAHCITGIPRHTVRVLVARQDREQGQDSISDVAYHVENMILHPSYNNSNTADLAILKLEPRSDMGSVQWGNYTAPVCLPASGHVSHVSECEVAGWAVTTQGQGSLRSAVLGHTAVLQNSEQCLQSAAGNIIRSDVSEDDVQCAEERCNRFVSGPTFCKSQNSGKYKNNCCPQTLMFSTVSDRYQVVGLPSSSSDWCRAGVSTNIAHHTDWILRTVEYLDSEFTSAVTDNTDDAADNDDEEHNPCSSDPCGQHALCWNGEGDNYLCTCMSEFPHGNPYVGCGECQYDSHCAGQRAQCVDQQCVVTAAPDSAAGYQAPPEYVSVAGHQYYVSTRSLSWSQAQYDCMNREGNNAEECFTNILSLCIIVQVI